MLWTLMVILLLAWLFGFGVAGAGSIIHLLLVAALVVLIVNVAGGARRPM